MKTKKQNTTRGRGTPGCRNNAQDISLCHHRDKIELKKDRSKTGTKWVSIPILGDKTKKQNTTRGRGTPGCRSYGSELSRQHVKDRESLEKMHKTFIPADPKPDLVGEEPTADPIPKASTSERKPKISKFRVTAQKSRNHAPDPSRAWCDDKTKLKELQKKPGVKKGSGAKWVTVTLPTDKIKNPKPTAQKPGKKP